MYLWGTKELKIISGSYNPPFSKKQRSIMELIPSSDDLTANSIVQDGGRERYIISMDGFCNTYAEYLELHSDYMLSTNKTFIGPSDETLTAFIFDLSEPKREMRDKFNYTITLMEV